MAIARAITTSRLHPRTTVGMTAMLSDESMLHVRRLLGKNTTTGTWYETTVRETVALTIRSYYVIHEVTHVTDREGRESYNRMKKLKPIPGSEVVAFWLRAGTKLHVVDTASNSDVLAYVPNYESDGRLGQLTFRSAGVVTFTPYTRETSN